MTNYWLDKVAEVYRKYVRDCLEIFYTRRKQAQMQNPWTTGNQPPSSKKLINAIESYAKTDKVVFKKEFEEDDKVRIVCEEWYRLTRQQIV
jgi:hypothetical protein